MPRATTQNKDVDLAKLLPEAMSGFIVQLQPVSASNSVAQVATRPYRGLRSGQESAALVESGVGGYAHCSRSHTNMGGLHYHPGSGCHLGPGCR